jgi:hypothetical protein
LYLNILMDDFDKYKKNDLDDVFYTDIDPRDAEKLIANNEDNKKIDHLTNVIYNN